jgi:hypothetical protein
MPVRLENESPRQEAGRAKRLPILRAGNGGPNLEDEMSLLSDLHASWVFFRSLRDEGNKPDDCVLDGPPQKPEPELVDDWEEVRGNWIEVDLCHCGYERVDHYTKVCPRCGHKDKWETKVGSKVYEYSRCRYNKALTAWNLINFEGIPKHLYTRNNRFALWTPEDCPVRDV